MDWGLDIFPKGTDNLYRKLNGKLMIELELHTAMQLFNSFDPAPFHEKELDREAEEYIYNTVGEFPLKKPLGIFIYLPPSEADGETEHILKKAIRNHFSYKKLLTEIELKKLLQRGRRNMTIATLFLFLCLLVIRLLSTLKEGLVHTMLSEGFTIIGWVAMWEPINVFLYGWWPVVQKRNIYRKILSMDVNIIAGSPSKVKLSDPRFSPKKIKLRADDPEFFQ
ncbi:hypothetical protein [Methanosarcina mazei]|jgi:hypothetical protein|uniref:Uncharacterized protein n=6 Tax=Methanosarcina mazei TaxID=2209 RepID=A0A0F8LHZ2_METMZ|nr:hypothetical protein [Methanosarcina mazei]AGF98506.1 hypothetical protein MmTuc01_3249 [Methanosarcina mazei Tuc01]AKB40475.1 hypothetical protein MSMAW_1484 [Methanosarcina mazei WWM610]AKB72767.1 hypothetical protein MSMAC_2877 [Methanosarcina mazei C16]KKF99215.1 hypothetical protein DU40_16815 [Methanosarcina mazei]KKG01554.1 hypothetical protein DU31_18130 [Methanosarcina mazei]